MPNRGKIRVMTIQTDIVIPPPLAAWDFDSNGCPPGEIEHCCFYEYSLESPTIKKIVRWHRQSHNHYKQAEDKVGDLISDRWYGLPWRVLADHPEFPHWHWLEIDQNTRTLKVENFPAKSQTAFLSRKSPRYSGPKRTDSNRLAGALVSWETIKKEKNHFRDMLLMVTPNSTSRWQRRLANLSPTQRRLTFTKLQRAYSKRIERLYRPRREFVIYEVDWTLRPEELKRQFGIWVDLNRVHDSRPRGGGHATTDLELLKALGAQRLINFFKKHQGGLSQPYKAQQLYHALNCYTSDLRNAAGRPARPLYSNPSGWNNAEKIAAEYLTNFSVNSSTS
jgi:hypothetical protein